MGSQHSKPPIVNVGNSDRVELGQQVTNPWQLEWIARQPADWIAQYTSDPRVGPMPILRAAIWTGNIDGVKALLKNKLVELTPREWDLAVLSDRGLEILRLFRSHDMMWCYWDMPMEERREALRYVRIDDLSREQQDRLIRKSRRRLSTKPNAHKSMATDKGVVEMDEDGVQFAHTAMLLLARPEVAAMIFQEFGERRPVDLHRIPSQKMAEAIRPFIHEPTCDELKQVVNANADHVLQAYADHIAADADLCIRLLRHAHQICAQKCVGTLAGLVGEVYVDE